MEEDIKYFGGYHFGAAGWVCPKCGKIWSPMTPGCYDCNNPQPSYWSTETHNCSHDCKGDCKND